MAALFTDAARFGLWLEVNCSPPRRRRSSGSSPPRTRRPAGQGPTVDDVFVSDVLTREEVTNHDVAAFVDVVQDRIGAPAGSFIHFGLTSSTWWTPRSVPP